MWALGHRLSQGGCGNRNIAYCIGCSPLIETLSISVAHPLLCSVFKLDHHISGHFLSEEIFGMTKRSCKAKDFGQNLHKYSEESLSPLLDNAWSKICSLMFSIDNFLPKL